ncbi:MAG: tetratricopeptide repeat protein [Ardenticatenia bacterium]|nr:tetratricopeptide repeat protein [Ardenticatenia bacterium]
METALDLAAGGSAFFFAISPRGQARQRLQEYVRRRLAGRPVLRIFLTPEHPLDPRTVGVQLHAIAGQGQPVVFVDVKSLGVAELEALASPTVRRARWVLQTLNFQREKLVALNVPIVFWVTSLVLKAMSTWAADLFSAHSGIFDLEPPLPPLRPDDLSRDERRMRDDDKGSAAHLPEKEVRGRIRLYEEQLHREAGKRWPRVSRIAGLEEELVRLYLALGELPQAALHSRRAVAHYRKLATRDAIFRPHLIRSLIDLNSVLLSMGQWEEALTATEEAVEISLTFDRVDSENLQPLLSRALRRIAGTARLGEVERARELFARGVEADPSDAAVWQAWALMEARLGEVERARELFARGVEADPGHAPVWQAWALMEARLGEVGGRGSCSRAGGGDPGHAPVWRAWALMEARLREVERARELFARGVEADPGHAPTWQAWALMEARLREVERARELFARGVEADPGHAPAWQAWALMEARLGRHEEARRLFRQGVEADPANAPTWQAWALMEARLGRHEEARRLLDEGLSRVQEPRGRALLLSTRGSMLARQQKYAEAEADFRAALALHEGDPLTHYHFAVDCLLPQNRRQEACQHLRRAEELRPRKRRDRERVALALRRAGGG